MPGGGYALGSGNSITNYMKIENYKAMLDIGTKYGKYPTNISSKKIEA
jgi:uroporphyrinogen decarboxylase